MTGLRIPGFPGRIESVDLGTLWIFGAWSVYVITAYRPIMTIGTPWGGILHEVLRSAIFLAPVLFMLPRGVALGWGGASQRGALGMVFGVSIVWALVAACAAVGLQAKAWNTQGLTPSFWLTTFSTAVVVEEIAFRGMLLRGWLELGRPWAVTVTAALFVAIHWPGWWWLERMATPLDWLSTSASIFVLGLLLGSLYRRYRSIWPGVLLHAVNNFVAQVFI